VKGWERVKDSALEKDWARDWATESARGSATAWEKG
jgi:hypothetical protein